MFGVFSLREVRLFQKQADDSKRLQSLQTDNEVMWRYILEAVGIYVDKFAFAYVKFSQDSSCTLIIKIGLFLIRRYPEKRNQKATFRHRL